MKLQHGGVIFRLLALLLFILLLAALYLVRHPLMQFAGHFLVVDEDPIHADAIIVLSDDNYLGERASRAAELFRAGWAPRVVASGRYLRPYASISDLIQRDLVERGVPEDAILKFPHRASDTREEAIALSSFLAQHGWHRVIVVTSNSHTRRARFICERKFPAGIELRLVAAHDSDFDPNSWWRTRAGVKTFFLETVGLVVAMWEARHDSPPPATTLVTAFPGSDRLEGQVPFGAPLPSKPLLYLRPVYS